MIHLPDLSDLGVSRDDVLREAAASHDGSNRKLALADAAQRLATAALARVADDGVREIRETHVLIFGDCCPDDPDSAADWLRELREALDLSTAAWKSAAGGKEVIPGNNAPVAQAIVQAARAAGDGKFLAIFGVTAAADYAKNAAPRGALSVLVAPPALPGAVVVNPQLADVGRAFVLLSEALAYETSKLAGVAAVSASSLRTYLAGKGVPRAFSVEQATSMRVEIDRRADLLRQAADIFGAVRS